MAWPEYSSVEYMELPGSPKEETSTEKGGGFSATIELLTPWNKRNLLCADILGNFRAYPRIWRDDDPAAARAVSASIEPFTARTLAEVLDPSNRMASYDFAKVSIKYKLEAEGADYVTESLEPTGEMLSLEPTQFYHASELNACKWQNHLDGLVRWEDYGSPADGSTLVYLPRAIPGHPETASTPFQSSDGTTHYLPPKPAEPGKGREPNCLKETDQGPSRIVRGWNYTLTFNRVMSLPQAILDLTNHVNKDTVVSRLLGVHFDPETLLFNPPTAKRRWNYTAFPYWELTYKLGWRQEGWNRYWNPKFKTTLIPAIIDFMTASTASAPATASWKIGKKATYKEGYDCFYLKIGVTSGAYQKDGFPDSGSTCSYSVYERYRNFPLGDFSLAFPPNLDVNVSPWKDIGS
jgi:hypothetical protein